MEAVFVRRPDAGSCTIRDRPKQLKCDVFMAMFGCGAAQKKGPDEARKRQKKSARNMFFTL
jgi:hypothetical protein